MSNFNDLNDPEKLAYYIKIVLEYSQLNDANPKPHNSNFSKLEPTEALQLIKKMKKVFTISHEESWEYEIKDIKKYAIKVYYSKHSGWDISIISTGLSHIIDAVFFLLRIRNFNYINLENAMDMMKIIEKT